MQFACPAVPEKLIYMSVPFQEARKRYVPEKLRVLKDMGGIDAIQYSDPSQSQSDSEHRRTPTYLAVTCESASRNHVHPDSRQEAAQALSAQASGLRYLCIIGYRKCNYSVLRIKLHFSRRTCSHLVHILTSRRALASTSHSSLSPSSMLSVSFTGSSFKLFNPTHPFFFHIRHRRCRADD